MKKIKAKLNLPSLKIPKRQDVLSKAVKIIDNRKTISRILNGLYVSGSIIGNDVRYLIENKFTHVVNCSSKSSSSLIVASVKTLNLNLRDDSVTDIISPLFETIKFLDTDQTPNKKILFHCNQGVSRGPALMAGYLMWKFDLSKDEAMSVMYAKRPCIDMNFGFLVQLAQWEIFLRGSQIEDEINIFKIGDNILSINENEIQFCDNIKDLVIVRLNKFFIFVEGEGSTPNPVTLLPPEKETKEYENYLKNFYINYHKGKNVINWIKKLKVNFKEFSKEKSFGEMIKKLVHG